MRSFKIILIAYIIAISWPFLWAKIMPINCDVYICSSVEVPEQKPGTILFVETSTFYNHVLIYTENNVVVESVRPFTTVETKTLYDGSLTLAGEAVYALELKESDEYNSEQIMQEAANFAASHTDAYYDINFINNKNGDYSELNCSEIVWAAYYESGIDIDGDGGIGVYPNDIYESEYLEVVEVYYPE